VQSNIDFHAQTDEEILSILLDSQKIKYQNRQGVQFIQKSGRKTLTAFLELKDIRLFRQFKDSHFEKIDWTTRTMSYTALSAWLSSLFPPKIYPIPTTGLNETINYLFDTDLVNFPKTGSNYISACQEFMKKSEVELKNYPIEEIHLKTWNKYYSNNIQLNIKPKLKFDKGDWNWLTQDLHLFIYRKVLNLYKSKGATQIIAADDFEASALEGQAKLAIHIQYERDSLLIKKIKEIAIRSNPMLNCDVCGFSFYEKYGELGQGFIEAHHKTPLSETKQTLTTRDDIDLVCSNCHQMIHKGISELDGNSIMTIDELKSRIIE
jgi:predicted HNH restriction endonuclease